jgi:hypothetical protein
MKKVLLALIVISLVAMSCNRGMTIQQAAAGGGKKCGRHLR